MAKGKAAASKQRSRAKGSATQLDLLPGMTPVGTVEIRSAGRPGGSARPAQSPAARGKVGEIGKERKNQAVDANESRRPAAKAGVVKAAGAKAAGTKASATKAAGTKAAGTKASVTKAAGTKVAGTKAAGTKVVGTKVAGTKVAGAKVAGAKVAGAKASATKAAGAKAAGTKASATKAAGAKAAGTKASVTKAAGAKASATKAAGAKASATKASGAKASATKAAVTQASAAKAAGAKAVGAKAAGTKASATKASGAKPATKAQASTAVASAAKSAPAAKRLAGKATAAAGEPAAIELEFEPPVERQERRSRAPKASGDDLFDDTAPVSKPSLKRRSTAEQMATRQREISVSEFFSKNRHLLGFDSPTKALLTTVKEAVDNSLDACEEAGILPEIIIEIRDVPGASDRFVVCVEDNGPGIVKAQVPKIFGKLLYGSKFHRLKQSRGQQGIGISAAAMYGQLTTGKPVQIWTKTGKGRTAHHLEVQLDTRKNVPVVISEAEESLDKAHGTRVEIEMQADYGRGQRYLLRYVEQTVLSNPHLTLTYKRPNAEPIHFPLAAPEPPKEALEIKPHPYGVEVGTLMLMAKESRHRDVRSFLQHEFSRVSGQVADEILTHAGLRMKLRTQLLADDRENAEKLRKGILATRIMAPPTNCLSPIGDELIRKGLISFLSVVEDESDPVGAELDLFGDGKKRKGRKKGPEPTAEEKQAALEKAVVDTAPPEPGEEVIKGKKFFIVSTTRPPKVYRGNPFQVEVGLAWGGDWPQDKTIELYRFANRVPLLFQRGACGITDAVVKTEWRKYEMQQPRGSLPVGPMALLVHIASVWVPFTSESKEAIAHYPELLAEIRLALQECGRKLATFIRKRKAAAYELKRRSVFELYIEELARSLHEITGDDQEKMKGQLLDLAREVTGGEETDEILDRAVGKKRSSDSSRALDAPLDSDESEEEEG